MLEAALSATRCEAERSIAQIESRILTESRPCSNWRSISENREGSRRGESWEVELAQALGDPVAWMTLVAWVLVRHLGEVGGRDDRRK